MIRYDIDMVGTRGFALVRMALLLLVIVMSYSFKGTRIWKTSSKTS